MKNYKIISMLVILLAILIILASNPLRRSESYIKEYVLYITPLGSSFEYVLSKVQSNEWKLKLANESSGFYHQRISPNRIVGEKSIRASLGDYQGIPFQTNVTIFWGFDSQGKLTDIWVWKTRDGL